MEPDNDKELTDTLLAALYTDGADDETARVPDELKAELDSCRNLRSLFADLPEVEAPAAVNAKLMSAAAKAVAPKAAEGEGLWQRVLNWFEPLRAHPALAAMASLVLVLTIGGVLYVNNKADVAEPSVASEAAQSAEAPQNKEASKTEALTTGDEEEERGESKDSKSPPDDFAAKGQPAKKDRKPAKRPRSSGKRPFDKSKLKKSDEPVGATIEVGTDIDLGAVGTASTAPSPDPAPPIEEPKVKREPNKQVRRKLTASEKETRDKTLGSLRTKAKGFAKNGDCTSVKKIGSQVQEIDHGYYDTTFLADSLISGCYRVSK